MGYESTKTTSEAITCSFASFLGRNQFIFHEIGEKPAKNIFGKLYGQ